MSTMQISLNDFLLTNSKIKTNTGVYVLYFRGCKHFYCGSSKNLTKRLYQYWNNTNVISNSVKNMLDCMTVFNLQIQLHETSVNVTSEDLKKIEDDYLKKYIQMYGEEWCLNSRSNDKSWYNPKFIKRSQERGKKIECYDKLGFFVAEFECINDAVRHFKYQNSGNICANLAGRTKYTKGLKFKYV